jgi:hypothetical protein
VAGTRFHRLYGTPLTDWISSVSAELPLDGVFLLQPVCAGIEGYNLSGPELDDFVLRCIENLLDAGAVPADVPTGARLPGYEGEHYQVARKIVAQWRSGEVVADHDGLWFVLPDRLTVG